MTGRPTVDEVHLADPLEAWEGLGLTADGDGVVVLGGVRLRLGCEGRGIVGWTVRDLAGEDLDGLPTTASTTPPPEPSASPAHPLGATAVDHVVAVTPDLERTAWRLRAAGLDLRRTRQAGDGMAQAFFAMGPCLLELAGPVEGPVRFWGLTLVVEDLDAAAARLGDRLGPVRDAVQPGRRIATVRREAGLGAPLALMSPRDLG